MELGRYSMLSAKQAGKSDFWQVCYEIDLGVGCLNQDTKYLPVTEGDLHGWQGYYWITET